MTHYMKMTELKQMDKDNWNKFCKVFNLDVQVTVKKQVDRSDIIQTLVNEGEFIFKGENGSWTQMNLSKLKGKATKEQIKLFKEVLWDGVIKFMEKPKLKDAKQKEEVVKG